MSFLRSSPAAARPAFRLAGPFIFPALLCSAGALLGALGLHFARAAVTTPPPRHSPHSLSPAPGGAARPAALAAAVAAPVLPAAGATPVLTALKKILRTRPDDWRQIAALAVWADAASEADLALALALGPQAAEDDAQLEALHCAILARLAEIDGPLALRHLQALQRETVHAVSPEAQRALFASWLAWDPQGAAAGALAQLRHDPADFDRTMEFVVEEIGREFPWLAREVAGQLARSDDPETRELGYRSHAGLLVAQLERGADCAAALAWIDTTPTSPDERQYLLRELVAHRLNHDDHANALLVFRQVDRALDPDLTLRMIRELAATEPHLSVQLVLDQPSGKLRRAAASALTAAMLAGTTPTAALNWLVAQPTHADFDPAFTLVAAAFERTDPQNAWRCATKLTDNATNRLVAVEFGFKWLKADFSRAAQEIPADLVERYRRTSALLQQLTGLFPESKDELYINWRGIQPVR